MTRPEWIEVGRLSRAHGVRGELRVLPTSDNPERFAPGSVVYGRSERTGLAGPRLREQVRLTIRTVRGDEGFPIVAFEEITDRDAAASLRGYILEIRADELPELDDDEFYPFDLVGLEVRDEEGTARGHVADAVETPAHALLVIEPVEPGGCPDREAVSAQVELLVPFVQEAVPFISIDDGYLVVTTRFLEPA